MIIAGDNGGMNKPTARERAIMKWCDDQPEHRRAAAHDLRVAASAVRYLRKVGKPAGAAERTYVAARHRYLALLDDDEGVLIPMENLR